MEDGNSQTIHQGRGLPLPWGMCGVGLPLPLDRCIIGSLCAPYARCGLAPTLEVE